MHWRHEHLPPMAKPKRRRPILPPTSDGWFIGIPRPTDPVPAAIMPTLPTGADFGNHEWINTYDPLTATPPIAPPSVVTENVYVVNNFYTGPNPPTNVDMGDNAIGGVVYGTTLRPRAGLPNNGPYPAGTIIYVYGEDTPLPTSSSTNRKVDYTQWDAKNYLLTLEGTAADPCWIVGIDKPRIGTDRIFLHDNSHLIFDGIYLEGFGAGEGGGIAANRNRYLTFRNGGQYGSSTGGGGGQAYTLGGTLANPMEFIIYYNNEMAYFGAHQNLPVSLIGPKPADFHGYRPFKYTRWMWVIGNRIHHIGADACQVANSEGEWGAELNLAGARPHYLYWADNECYHLGENMLDCKNSYHVIASQNRSYNCDEWTMIMPNNDEGPLTGYHWSIANHLSGHPDWGLGNAGGIIHQGDEGDNYSAVIGNFIRDFPNTTGVNTDHADRNDDNNKSYTLYNTIVRCATGIRVNQWSSHALDGWVMEYQGNIVYDCDTEFNVVAKNGDNTILTLIDNILYDPDGPESITDPGANIDNESGTSFDDPNFNNPSGTAPSDFVPQSGSPAIDGTTEHQAFTDFENMYGIDIRKDILGTVRPQGSSFDIGMVEAT